MKRVSKTVIVIGAVPPPNHGVTIFTESLLKSQISSRFSVIHLDTSDRRSLDNLGKLDATNVYLAIRSVVRLSYLCVTRYPAIVYLPSSQNNLGLLRDGLFILIPKLLSRARVVMHYHGGESFTQYFESTNKLMKSYIQFVFRKVDLAIVLGESLVKVLHGLVRDVRAIPNGIAFNPDIARRNEKDKTVLNVSYLGNLFRAKGILDLLDAAAIVVKKHPNVRFRFAGSWRAQEEDTRIEAGRIIEQHRLSDRMDFVGPVMGEQKERFLLDTDIFVFPSWYDAFGLVNLEAMAAGCPVIATKGVGAISEIVIDGETGLLFEKQNVQMLADSIARLIEDPALRKRMGSAGRERFEKHYRIETTVHRLSEAFESVMEFRENQ